MDTKEDFGAHSQKETLATAERKFTKSCEQIALLNNRLDELQQRYLWAKFEDMRCFRYNLRLRLACIEGARNMYYEYAHVQAEVIAELRLQLFGEVVDIITDENEMDMDQERVT